MFGRSAVLFTFGAGFTYHNAQRNIAACEASTIIPPQVPVVTSQKTIIISEQPVLSPNQIPGPPGAAAYPAKEEVAAMNPNGRYGMRDQITSGMTISQSVATNFCLGSVVGLGLGHVLRRVGRIIAGFFGMHMLCTVTFCLIGWLKVDFEKIKKDVTFRRRNWNSSFANFLETAAFYGSMGAAGYLAFVHTTPPPLSKF